jgi:hypothetical protein
MVTKWHASFGAFSLLQWLQRSLAGNQKASQLIYHLHAVHHHHQIT